MKRVALVIPDAGPLISLGKAQSLEILLKLDLPIYIVDQVYFEVTREPSFEDAKIIRQFAQSYPDRVNIVETQVGNLARMEREINPSAPQRQLGEAAITDFLSNQLDKIVEPLDPVLLLFEDSDLTRMNVVLRQNVHLLSTKALLIGMERLGVIASEAAIWEAIIASGRTPSDEIVDQSAPATYGGSYWQ
ncbi:MAG: hypothetical protein DRR19_20155 [Candidatus Parabeggiatoa sp. nov. 1]|nr:MAG: hypothetical protein DRR19_20155 [Gammaproteobacteria bacterium]